MSEPRLSASARVLDCLVVTALTALCLWGLDQSYSSRSYLVVGLLGLVGATLLALGVDTKGRGTEVFLLVALPSYILLGASVALRSYEYAGLPTLAALGRVLTATLTAPVELLTTIPPVDPTGSVMVVPYAVGFMLGGAAAWTALRTARPALPVVPMLLAMVVTILLGTTQQDNLLLRSGAFAGLAVWWVSIRGARSRGIAHARRGQVMREVSAGLVVATSVSLLASFVPSGEHINSRVVLRGRVGEGHDVSQLDNPLSGFRKFTRQPEGTPDNVYETRLLGVRGLPEGHRLRFVTLDNYDGVVWTADNKTVPGTSSDMFQRIATVVAASRPGPAAEVRVEVREGYTSGWLPLAGELTRITFDYVDGRAQREDVRYNPATASAAVIAGLGAKDDYTFTAVLPDLRLERTMRPYPSSGSLQPAGAFLDGYLEPWRAADLPPMRKVFSLARYLRKAGRYSDGAEEWEKQFTPGHDPERLGEGFIGARAIVGDDEQYAAFMALAANRLGVPARVVVGVDSRTSRIVYGWDVSAWVEIRVRDGSWRTLATAEFMSHRPPKRREPPKESPEQFVREDEEEAVTETAERPNGNGQQQESEEQAGRETENPRLWWILPLVGLTMWLVPGAKWVRRRRRRGAAQTSSRFVGAWRELLDLAVDLGRGVPYDVTREEQARRLERGAGLAETAENRIFAPEVPTDDEAAAFWREVTMERRAMVREAGALRRVRAFWSPVSLILRLSSNPGRRAGR